MLEYWVVAYFEKTYAQHRENMKIKGTEFSDDNEDATAIPKEPEEPVNKCRECLDKLKAI